MRIDAARRLRGGPRTFAGVTGRTTTVTYRRDSLDRIIARTETVTGGASTTTRFGFTASGDSPDLTLTSGNVLIERTLGLAGGASVTTRTSGNRT